MKKKQAAISYPWTHLSVENFWFSFKKDKLPTNILSSYRLRLLISPYSKNKERGHKNEHKLHKT